MTEHPHHIEHLSEDEWGEFIEQLREFEVSVEMREDLAEHRQALNDE